MSSQRDPADLMRNDFTVFATKVFNILNPGQDLNPTPAFCAVAHKLEQVAQGRIRRLLINVPPRSGKTVLASIALPAFVLGRDPRRRVICASYSNDLAAKFSRDCRTVMQHPSYRNLFPTSVITGKNTESELEMAQGGFRYATSVGGTLTGRGGNLIVLDDPQKPDEANSAAARERVWEWFTGTVGSRLDNKAEDAIVVVMQRLHVDDLSGLLLERGGWEHLSIPAIAEEKQTLEIGWGRTYHREEGEVLDASREDRATLDQYRNELGSAKFEAQYQQQPVPQEGSIVKWPWFRTYQESPPRNVNDGLIISWDLATKAGEENDYTVGIIALVKPMNQIFITNIIRNRFDFPTLRKLAHDIHLQSRASVTVIEDISTGTGLIQELRNKGISAVPWRPIGDKVSRLHGVTPMIEGGQVHLPARADWLDQFRRELLLFPNSTHDDQVDAFSQLLGYIKIRFNNLPLQTSYSRHGVRPGTY